MLLRWIRTKSQPPPSNGAVFKKWLSCAKTEANMERLIASRGHVGMGVPPLSYMRTSPKKLPSPRRGRLKLNIEPKLQHTARLDEEPSPP